jgi:RimJ/RimL family protein N-acetyltransferase
MIETRRLRLRLVTAADRDDLIALERDPQVMRFLNGGRPTPDDGIDETVDFRMPRGGEGDVWGAIERESAAFLGWFSLRSKADPRTAELGYRLHQSAWGRGYASEGAGALIDHGFGNLGLERVWAQTMTINQASRRVLEKLGLKYRRTFHPELANPPPGFDEGEVEYEITRNDWARAAAPPYGDAPMPRKDFFHGPDADEPARG